MITVTLIGLDPYSTIQLSKELTPKLAEIYETTQDNINFYAPDCLYVHNGVEQNTYCLLVRVNAPKKVSVLERDVVRILHAFLEDLCIHMQITFYYYSQDNYHEFINKDYPRFMTESNTVVEEDDTGDEDEFQNEEVYLGNVFAEMNKDNDK